MALPTRVLEGAHDALEILGLLDQADRQILQRRLALQRVLQVVLGRGEQVRRAGEKPAVRLELGGDGGHLTQRVGGELGEPCGVLVDQAIAGLAKVWAALSVLAAKFCVLPVGCSSTLARFCAADSTSSLSDELEAASLSIRPVTPSASCCAPLRRPKSVSAVRLASALTSVAFSARSRSVERVVTSSTSSPTRRRSRRSDRQRPRGFVEDLGDLGRALGKHGVELSRVLEPMVRAASLVL